MQAYKPAHMYTQALWLFAHPHTHKLYIVNSPKEATGFYFHIFAIPWAIIPEGIYLFTLTIKTILFSSNAVEKQYII